MFQEMEILNGFQQDSKNNKKRQKNFIRKL